MLPKPKVKLLVAFLAAISVNTQISLADRTISDFDGGTSDGKTYYQSITHADFGGTGGIRVGNNVTVTTGGSGEGGGIGNASGLYVNYLGYIEAGDHLTLNTTGVHADGIRTNPSNRTGTAGDAWWKSDGELDIGDYLKITVAGGSADCVNLNGYSTLEVGDNASLINNYSGAPYGGTLKEGAHGIRLNHATSAKFGENTFVSVAGESSHAVYFTSVLVSNGPDGQKPSGGSLTLGNNATLKTLNKSSHGVYITTADSWVAFKGTANVTTLGTSSNGLYLTAANAKTSFDGVSNITTEGNTSHGVYLSSTAGLISFNDGGSILTNGAGSHALNSRGGLIESTGDFTLTTTGDGSYGIFFYNTGKVALGNGASITTSGKESHAISANYKANATFDSTTNILPDILVQGEGSAVLHATYSSSSGAAALTLAGTASLNMGMTASKNLDNEDITTWGAKAERYGTINFTENSSTGGTGLLATGTGASAYGTLKLKDSADASGSNVKLEGYGVLDLTDIDEKASIGSLQSDNTTTEVRFGEKTLSVGTNNTAGNGSMITDTTFAGKLTGGTGSTLEKVGDGTTLRLSGLNSSIENVNVHGGTLSFHQEGEFHITGDYTTYANGTTQIGEEGSHLLIDGTFTQKEDSNLVVILGADPDIRAKDAVLNGTVTLAGFDNSRDVPVKASEATVHFYTLISTTDGITGDFINNPLLTTGLDYLLHHGYLANDGKDYVLGFELAWTRGRQNKGTGSFTLAAGTAFDIDINLEDQTGDPDYEWDGKTLHKKGEGLLLISSDSTYTGNTIVDEGTLQVTGSIVSHVVNSSNVDAPGRIGSLDNKTGAVARIGLVDGDVTNAGTVYLNKDTMLWGNLHNTGLLDFVNVGRELTVNNFSGSGTMRMDVDLTTGDADRIIVNGDISGSQSFIFANVGTGPVVYTERIEEIVKVLGNVATGTSMTGTLDEGLYKYKLLQQHDKTWDLVRGDDYSDETQVIVNTAAFIATGWFTQLDNIIKRMGDIRLGASNTHDIWVRSYGHQLNGKLDIAGINGLREYQWGTDVGYDHMWYPDARNILALGGFFGYQGSHRTVRDTYRTRSDTASYYMGMYGTWLHYDGWYADLVVKGQYFDNDYTSISGNGGYKDYAIGTSLEFGRQIMNQKGWFVEPSLQIAHMHLFNSNHTTQSGMRVSRGDADIYRLSLMTRAGKTIDMGDKSILQPYVKAGAEGQVSNGGGLRIDGLGFRPSTDGVRGVVGAGLIWQIDDASQVHIDYEASFGDKYTKPWGLNVGYRYQF